MLRKQDVKDTKINLQKITKARDIQRVAMVLPDIEGLFTLEDDRLSKAAVVSKGKRMITAITEGYASRGFVIKSHKRERKGEKRVQMYSL
jgi:hypothetical protein